MSTPKAKPTNWAMADTQSEITITNDNGSTYSTSETLTDTTEPKKKTLLQRLRHPRSNSSSKVGDQTDPYKRWEARHYAFQSR
ncbi:hypothetical protein S40285_10067 [Stachybotrys chlorohalonatus IBT 40285]|uniref:Uncharacterized protein n=1 Tax=Stachybotrys chlorohalonatus (strain IBT 40285) TaxID=1283841 RepID=A0A084QMD1_STAC4|nr:hypothetical protein S40285_10067 [Stachybotrys chlorohalonata IBT 40285]